jgi:hypothetical protein
MEQKLFDKYNAVYELDQRFNTYAICGRDCAAQVRKFIKEEEKSDLPITYIFDQGDKGKGLLTREMVASGLPAPVFQRSRPDRRRDKDDPFHVQLQACDFAAWELRRGMKDTLSGRSGKALRTSLRLLAGMRRIWKETKEPDLQGLIQVAGINKRNEKTTRAPN